MTASLSLAPAAVTRLAALRALVAREFGVSLGEIASLRTVRPVAELVSVSTVAGLSTCCGHVQFREDGEDCGCQDVSCRLFVRVVSLVKGGEAREITIDGDVTLADGRFDVRDWSWESDFAEKVEALGLDLDDVESAIEADV